MCVGGEVELKSYLGAKGVQVGKSLQTSALYDLSAKNNT